MRGDNRFDILRYEKSRLRPVSRPLVREFPLRLVVNGRELATLVASPHQLNFLTAGFLRLQGFIRDLDDLLTLGVCADFGRADVRIRGAVPERLTPTLTSGCGTGITFALPAVDGRGEAPPCPRATQRVVPTAVFALMQELARHAEQYRSHGGIHSAAVGDGRTLLLYAEDVGRHNTLDRLAGEALFRGLDLRGKLLATSGRVSSEMVAKAARLGIALIASRTSATDLAVRMAEEAGITLISYLRGDTFEVCTHPQRLAVPPVSERIAGITGVILAGGESRRMGSDKSLLPLHGARFIDHAYRRLTELFAEVLIVTNSPDLYLDLPCRKVADLYPAQGSLAGIHSGLRQAASERIFVVACDMPFLVPATIAHLCRLAGDWDVVMPRGEQGPEPLHALYHKNCLPAMEKLLAAGGRKIVSFFHEVAVREVNGAELAAIDPEGISFRNINTAQEYFTLRSEDERSPPEAGRDRPACRTV
jgi:FdhD protein